MELKIKIDDKLQIDSSNIYLEDNYPNSGNYIVTDEYGSIFLVLLKKGSYLYTLPLPVEVEYKLNNKDTKDIKDNKNTTFTTTDKNFVIEDTLLKAIVIAQNPELITKIKD